jgi:methionyl-tRNA formyltransferase
VSPAFLGTSDFAAAVLRRLADSAHRPSLVVAPPDRRRGRGRRMASPPAADAARELGIEVLQVASVNEPDAVAAVLRADPDLAVVCAFGQLIKEPLIDEVEMLNVHPSLLPRWRGAAPIERAIMARDSETGVCVMRVTAGLDSGPVALCEATPIEPEETFGELWPRLARIGGDLIVQAMDHRTANGLEFAEQDDEQATYAEKIEAADRRLDPVSSAADLAANVRALTPHIGAYLELEGGERLGVRVAHVAEGDAPPQGDLVAADGELLLGTADGALALNEVQPPGGRPMKVADYLRGHSVPARVA